MSGNSDSSYDPATVPAGHAPPGLSHHDLDSAYDVVGMTAALGLLIGLSLIVYCIRIYAKIAIVKRLGWDDFVCSLALIGALLQIVCFGIASIAGPFGKHMWNITLAQFLGDNFTIVTGGLTLGLLKLAMFLFYLEIFWPLKWCRRTIYVGAILNSAFYLAVTIVQVCFMTPRPGETLSDRFRGLESQQMVLMSILISSVGLIINILLFVIPLRAILELRMVKMKKIRILSIFFTHTTAIIGSIMTTVFKVNAYDRSDLTYELFLINFFIGIEMFFGMIVSCSPLVVRAFSYHRENLSSIASNFSPPPMSMRKSSKLWLSGGTPPD